MDDGLFDRVVAAVQEGDDIETIDNKQINRIAGFDRKVCTSRPPDPGTAEQARITFQPG